MFSARIGKIQKARQYALEADRFTVDDDHVLVRGDHGSYTLSRQEDTWECSCVFYRRYGWCAHTLAFEWYTGRRPRISDS